MFIANFDLKITTALEKITSFPKYNEKNWLE